VGNAEARRSRGRALLIASAIAVLCLATSAGAEPRIRLAEEVWDFGDLARDSLADYRLEISNVGDRPLEVHHVRSSCACLLIVFEPTTLEPGGRAQVPLRYVPDRRKGETAKTVFVDSNDPVSPRLRFVVRGVVLEARAGEAVVEPNPCYLEAAPGRSTEQELALKNVGQGPLRLTGMRGRGCEVDAPEVDVLAPEEAVPFRIRLTPDRRWPFDYAVFVETDDPTEPFLIVPVYPLLEEEPTRKLALAGIGSSVADTVHAALFASLDCPHCLAIHTFYLSRIVEYFEGQFVLETAYVDREETYLRLVALERALDDTGNDIPALVVGSEILGGHEEIVDRLPGVLETLFARGGSGLPQVAPVAPSPSVSEPADHDTLYLAYFRKVGCKECDRAAFMLRRLARRFEPLVVRTFELTNPADQELNEALSRAYGVPESKRLIAPSLFGGGRYLVDQALDDEAAEEMLAALAVSGSPPPWEEVASERARARESIIARFRSLGVLTVVLGGLVDGVNPCAFATLIFFVSYLAFVGRAGREILWIGAAFTLAVFLTYLAVGLGALTFLQSLSVFRVLSQIVYGITAALAVGLGIYSVLDFVKLRRGKTSEVSLQLPMFLKRRIHRTIREQARTRRYVIAAFVTGAVVSILELACTGQVYLPTICFVTGVPELRAHAIAYLVLYNVMFVLPLIAVFIVSYYGATSDQLARFFQAHVAAVKLAMAAFFFALAAILLSVLL